MIIITAVGIVFSRRAFVFLMLALFVASCGGSKNEGARVFPEGECVVMRMTGMIFEMVNGKRKYISTVYDSSEYHFFSGIWEIEHFDQDVVGIKIALHKQKNEGGAEEESIIDEKYLVEWDGPYTGTLRKLESNIYWPFVIKEHRIIVTRFIDRPKGLWEDYEILILDK